MAGEGWGDGGWRTDWEEQVVGFLELQTICHNLDDEWLAKK